MVKNNTYYLAFVLMLFSLHGIAEKHRYVIYFSDKAESKYSITKPEEYLSAKSMARRTKQGIPISENDLPVNKRYLDSLVKYGATPFFTTKWLNAALVEAEETIIPELAKKSFVSKYEYVADSIKLKAKSERYELNNDPILPTTVNSSSAKQLEMIGADDMHLDGFTGKGILIAVLDAGYQWVNKSTVFSHLFDNKRILDVKDFTTNGNDVFSIEEGHGTSVLSCIAGRHEDDFYGTGYDANFDLYITEDNDYEYRIEEYNWLFAAERADSTGVDIISSSVGYHLFDDGDMDYTLDDLDGKTAIISKAAKFASDKGILVVNSAGNEGTSLIWSYITFPADVPQTLVVGAVDQFGSIASFSSKGLKVDEIIRPDVVALGKSVALYTGEKNTNKINTNSGTSFSAPLIAGFAAGLWQRFPDLTNMELKELILKSADKYTNPNTLYGCGLPDYNRAISGDILSVGDVIYKDFTVFPNPIVGNRVTVKVEQEFNNKSITFTLHSPNGQMLSQEVYKKSKKGELFEIKVDHFTKGIYVLTINVNGISKNVKLIRS